MGVVRDVTVDNLVTAVGNIDTSSLAQDSTLQDVVTAIGNISGGSDPVTNTTVNSLCKDTTGQSIASAISGLGSALGSDKANISGDNIASPATFRSNIGLSVYTTTTGINGGVLRKYDCVVQLKFDNTNVTNRGSIPSDYRPNARILTSCVLKKLSTNKWYQGMISIDTTGGFTIYYMNTDGTITDITTNSDWTISVSVTYIN